MMKNIFTTKQKMGRLAYATGLLSLVLAVALNLSTGGALAANLFAESPDLGDAASFSILGETEITNIPTSVIGADVGLSPAAGSNIAGLTSAEVGGTIFTASAGGPAGSVVYPTLLTTAINDMFTTYTTLSGLTCEFIHTGSGPVELSTLPQPLVPGVYCADSFTVTGTVTLPSGVFVFQSAATLTTATDSTISSPSPCDVWWQAATTADLGVDSTFVGNILSGTNINLQTRATMVGGRLLAQSAVTLDQNTITGCAVPYPYVEPTPTSAPTSAPTSEPSASTPEPETLPDTGGDLAGPGPQIVQFSLGALGLSLILFGVVLSRRTQKAER